MMFLDCPAWLDQDGAARCGPPAEVSSRFTMRSSAEIPELRDAGPPHRAISGHLAACHRPARRRHDRARPRRRRDQAPMTRIGEDR